VKREVVRGGDNKSIAILPAENIAKTRILWNEIIFIVNF
jgi:hypothetical protein